MRLKSVLLPAALAVAGLAYSTIGASAYVACNSSGDCWHTDTRPRVPGVSLRIHPDDWYFHQTWGADRHFRDYHTGRGYYRGGIWVTL
jgi:hypothetical protein